ncbi:hypothetical protein EDS67_08805 [candidate division KSB1 bacterium]|nr:MAG: hypothetical protein EDS67_08805 [candidate division KSB1 bacterium]MBC6950176.1 hypothetical protein [candidate division KSB1 bacterium]MCE7942779.1 hypothetical protein [Chlorobi bacterium CHB1]MDL1876947.1 hypothetical protein [Cytophagia bacterium CHB2]
MSAKYSCQIFFLVCAVLLSCAAEKPDTPASKDVAEQIARQQLSNGYVTSVKQVVDFGRLVYKVFVQNDSLAKRVTVDAATSRIIEIIDRTEELREAVAEGENVPHAICPIARAAAETKALQAVPGSIKRWKVLKENNRIIHKFDIATAEREEARIIVDDSTQEILAIEHSLPAR